MTTQKKSSKKHYKNFITKQSSLDDIQTIAIENGIALNKLYRNNISSAIYIIKDRTIYYTLISLNKITKKSITKFIQSNPSLLAYGKPPKLS